MEGTRSGRSKSGERGDSERRREAAEREGSQPGRPESPDSGQAEKAESGQAKKAEKRQHAKGIAGGVGIFVILAIYFVWIGSEMGSHAISGTFEMWAIFGAIGLGVVALVAGGAISRRRNHD